MLLLQFSKLRGCQYRQRCKASHFCELPKAIPTLVSPCTRVVTSHKKPLAGARSRLGGRESTFIFVHQNLSCTIYLPILAQPTILPKALRPFSTLWQPS